jgi:putative Mn2+ efflux pump MntP
MACDHWSDFLLLAAIGANMIRESFHGGENPSEQDDASLLPAALFPLALATSIDAFAVGITFAVLPSVRIAEPVAIIGATTFLLSALGLRIGNTVGGKYGAKAERVGGAILIAIGLRILLAELLIQG